MSTRTRGGAPAGSVVGTSGPSVLVHDDAADVLAVEHVLVALVDLVEPVPAGDQLVELQASGLPQPQQPRDVELRVALAEDGALHPALVADEDAGVVVDRAGADRGDRH